MNYKNFKKLLGDGVKRHGDGEGAFTLIELLIVIAILGTLAVVVLLALNPVQQLARTRDAGRISGVTQLGHALEAWSTSNGGLYPTVANWTAATNILVSSGELTNMPSLIAYSAPGLGGRPNPVACATNVVNATWCYQTYAANARAILFAKLESGANDSRCGGTNVAWAVYSTSNGRAGVLCTANQATVPADPGSAGYTVGNGLGQFLP